MCVSFVLIMLISCAMVMSIECVCGSSLNFFLLLLPNVHNITTMLAFKIDIDSIVRKKMAHWMDNVNGFRLCDVYIGSYKIGQHWIQFESNLMILISMNAEMDYGHRMDSLRTLYEYNEPVHGNNITFCWISSLSWSSSSSPLCPPSLLLLLPLYSVWWPRMTSD